MGSPKGIIIFFVVFMAIGLMGLAIGVMFYQEAQEVKGWSQTTGTVTYTSIISEYDPGGHDSPSHYVYYPVVNYYYSVGGQTYYGGTISKISSGSSDIGFAQGFINERPVGSQVTVYYDPGNPSDSVLLLNSDLEAMVPILIGMVFTLIGAIGAIYFFRKSRNA